MKRISRQLTPAIHCGCKLIATAHGSCLEDAPDQPFFYVSMGEKVFERYIILDKK